jgi:threonylcarbamoyladenosine tRNA methylthiotransferase MtaB
LGSIEATEIEAGLEDLLLSSGGMLAPHLHVPLQSGSDAVLRRMRRWHTREAYRSRVLELADRLDPIGLGADVIAGFPGETREDHEQTRVLIEELPFSYLHVFPWSPRAGTAATALPERVDRGTATARAAELRALGVEKGRRYVAGRAGGEALVAVESATYGLTGDYLRVRLRGGRTVPGRLIRVRLSGVAGDLGADVGATGRAALPVLNAGLPSTQSPAVQVSLERSASGKT